MEEKGIAYYLEDLNRIHNLSLEKLGEWKEKYPYSQMVHFLMAKKHQLEGFVDDMSVYHRASFYAVDREFLQQRMTNSESEIENFAEIIELDEPNLPIKKESVVETLIIEMEQTKEDSSDTTDDYFETDADLSPFAKWITSLGNIEEGENIIDKNPKKKKKKKVKKSKLERKIESSIVKKDEIVSEPLAAILAKQGHTDRAIEMYEQLSLIIPEKSSFFALQIEKLNNSK